jgi:UDP-3-O-[3-hydroxymyristoyl] N-acetylglucosamine deacetylase
MVAHKHTLKKEVGFSGVGVHSGKPVKLALKPSDSGRLVFRRMDLGGLELLPEPLSFGARNCTFLQKSEGRVQTVEHLLAALSMSGVDSVTIELDAEEVPILDGSAAPFVRAIAAAGTTPVPAGRKFLRVLKPFRLQEGDAFVAFAPDEAFRVSYTIEFSHPLIGRQELSLTLTPDSFAEEIAPARTFGFLRDAEKMRALGLALGSSLENSVVLDDKNVVNPPLRFHDEFVRHKILDLVGDMAVAGTALVGHVEAAKAGHALHLRALHSLLASPRHWVLAD